MSVQYWILMPCANGTFILIHLATGCMDMLQFPSLGKQHLSSQVLVIGLGHEFIHLWMGTFTILILYVTSYTTIAMVV